MAQLKILHVPASDDNIALSQIHLRSNEWTTCSASENCACRLFSVSFLFSSTFLARIWISVALHFALDSSWRSNVILVQQFCIDGYIKRSFLVKCEILLTCFRESVSQPLHVFYCSSPPTSDSLTVMIVVDCLLVILCSSLAIWYSSLTSVWEATTE